MFSNHLVHGVNIVNNFVGHIGFDLTTMAGTLREASRGSLREAALVIRKLDVDRQKVICKSISASQRYLLSRLGPTSTRPDWVWVDPETGQAKILKISFSSVEKKAQCREVVEKGLELNYLGFFLREESLSNVLGDLENVNIPGEIWALRVEQVLARTEVYRIKNQSILDRVESLKLGMIDVFWGIYRIHTIDGLPNDLTRLKRLEALLEKCGDRPEAKENLTAHIAVCCAIP
jgi:hypothetical protein